MADFVSIIIPNYNGATTIARCLEAALASRYPRFEVIVVDDCSSDNSVEIINQFPCKLVRLEVHAGASRARNTGAAQSKGDILFFTDADCMLQEDTLALACKALAAAGSDVVMGGTYTRIPFDNTFFSLFQSVFIHYSETKRRTNPDYIAAHAMVISAEVFRDKSGFREDFLPILEDVEFSHRLRRSGCKLALNPAIQVRHIFNFSLTRSLVNAFYKSMYWTIYSINNKDLLADSGTASVELKTNVLGYFLMVLLLPVFFITHSTTALVIIGFVSGINLWISRRLLLMFYRTGGSVFFIAAALYYLLLYPLPVGAGAVLGAIKNLMRTAKLEVNP
ncbi:MAG: glycosyltransferase [Gammaproteobacteria bacterium]